MEFLVAIIVAALAAAVSYATLNKSVADRIPVLKQKNPDEHFESRPLSMAHILAVTVLVAALSLGCAWKILSGSAQVIGICRMLLAMLCMAGAGCVDYRERRIPNFFPGVMAVGGMVLLAAGLLLQTSGAVAQITGSVVAAVLCVLFLVLASVLSRHGIGAGDIKLIGALALCAGYFCVLGTIFFGIMICSLAAIVVLISKKQGRDGSLPFGPFLFLGFVFTVLTGNF